jgi:hypothetical protein
MKSYIYIIAPVIAWPVSQGIKFVLSLRKNGVEWSDLIQSGGMPSSHAAMMLAIMTVVGINQGLKSVAFGIILCMSAVVIYDSLGVRRTTGEQTDAVKELAGRTRKPLRTVIHNARGHNYLEVLAGGLVGLLVGLLLNAIL